LKFLVTMSVMVPERHLKQDCSLTDVLWLSILLTILLGLQQVTKYSLNVFVVMEHHVSLDA
jgi:hypothetical protein